MTVPRFVLAVATVLLATGCATLFNQSRRTVPLSSTPTEAEVWINGSMRGITPFALELSNHDDHIVTFKKEGHSDVVCELTTSVGAGWVILDVLGGLLPVVVDAVTGAWKSLDQGTCNVVLPRATALQHPVKSGV